MSASSFFKSVLAFMRTSEANKAFFSSAEFVRALTIYNQNAGTAASAVVCLIGIAGLLGNSFLDPSTKAFAGIPNYFIYLAILAVNVPHILLLSVSKLVRRNPARLLNLELLNICLNAALASLTVLDTQLGSSYFLEFVIISIAILTFPYVRRGHEFLLFAVSLVSMLLALHVMGRYIAWQDIYDLFLFYALSYAAIVMRRWWFDSTQLLTHQLSEANRKLKTRSRTDELTGLLNRAALREDFPAITGCRMAVAMLDVDDFKAINDRFGHARGDAVLRDIGRTISTRFAGSNERCYRYGGDEFLVVAANVDEKDFAARLGEVARTHADRAPNGAESLSAGYCYGTVDSERNLRTFLRIADDNLYAAKAEGKNRVVGEIFRPEVLDYELATDPNLIDPLTELHNYDGFSQAVGAQGESFAPATIVFFDIDRFQDLNKSFGYRTGDDVLRTIATLIRTSFDDCVACRYDTDHFVVYTRDADPLAEAQAVQNAIAHAVPHFYVFLRIGIYHLDPDQPMAGLARAVDKAKYASDTLRRQHAVLYRFYNEELAAERDREAFVLGHFDDALKNGDLMPYFQPVVTLADGRCHGFEVLARWRDADCGVLSPNVFIPVLERSCMTYQLDSLMLDRACALFANLPAKAREEAYFSFNVSRNDFTVKDVPATIERIASSYGIPPHCIRVEITESVLSDSSNIRMALSDLRAHGFQIWLDDFGSGESSLNVLKSYEIDGAKLDQAFLRDAEGNDKAQTIVRALIQLCHTIGIDVVVEGVETKDQLEFVRQCGGDIVQGFYFSKPLPTDALLESPFWKGLEGKR